MANEEQLSILKQGVKVWNEWRAKTLITVAAVLDGADLRGADLRGVNFLAANLRGASLIEAKLGGANLVGADFTGADLSGANLHFEQLIVTNLMNSHLREASFRNANLTAANLRFADLGDTDFRQANLRTADLTYAKLERSNFAFATFDGTIFGDVDLREAIGLEDANHVGPSRISTRTFALSKGKIPGVFLRGCGLSDWEIETVKLYDPDLRNEEITNIQYKMYDARATQALQISPLFISYSHADTTFVDKVGDCLTEKGVRFWRDTHDMKAGRMEKQIDRAIRQNPTVLLVLSEHSLSSDWVEHEVRTAKELEKDMKRDVLCPVALDDSWKSSPWPKRVMEQIMEYNILDFSSWENSSKFEDMFRKLIDGLELFYKG